MARDAASPRDDPAAADVIRLRRVPDFDGFYRHEMPGLVALARALTRSQGAAEDLAQEAMIAAYRRWDEVATLDIPSAWVRRVCINMATSSLRRRAAEARAVLRLAGRRTEAAPVEPEDDRFWSEVRRLPRRQAQVVALHYVYDMAVDDIATTLDCSPNTVKTHLVRARAALGERLGEREDGR